MHKFKDILLSFLETDFEKQLFDAAMYNLCDTNNKLRFNNFAYSMRELTRHFLKRLAPDEDIKTTPWYKPFLKPDTKKEIITREQRIKFAIQGWFSDVFFQKALNFDYYDISKSLIKSIDDLSKYTHIEESTFDIPVTEVQTFSQEVLKNTIDFFNAVQESTFKVNYAIIESINEDFAYEVKEELDCIATHHEVKAIFYDDIDLIKRKSNTLEYKVSGTINVRLQYGSDGDLRRDDGYETTMDFPYTSNVTISFNNEDYSLKATKIDTEIDTEPFYGKNDSEFDF